MAIDKIPNDSDKAPCPGDLLIHARSKNQRVGHVSVVIKVEEE